MNWGENRGTKTGVRNVLNITGGIPGVLDNSVIGRTTFCCNEWIWKWYEYWIILPGSFPRFVLLVIHFLGVQPTFRQHPAPSNIISTQEHINRKA